MHAGKWRNERFSLLLIAGRTEVLSSSSAYSSTLLTLLDLSRVGFLAILRSG